ncbi:MAG: hypothetical protein K940chlam7_01402 [Chlamydiae bacterium]|nr:hypothetical protein [Chlamydiota bacterium]
MTHQNICLYLCASDIRNVQLVFAQLLRGKLNEFIFLKLETQISDILKFRLYERALNEDTIHVHTRKIY